MAFHRFTLMRAAIGLTLLLHGFPLLADTSADVSPDISPDISTALPYNPSVDIILTATGVATWIVSEEFKGSLTPSCRWCDRNADGSDSLNSLDSFFRNILRWNNTAAAGVVSNVTAFALAPLSAFGLTEFAAMHDHHSSDFAINALLVAEATILAQDLNQLFKLSVARERPSVHFAGGVQAPPTDTPSENNLSFYSGHTSLAFTLTFSSGTIASMRGYNWAPWVWGVGLTLSATTAYLRIASDAHYFTDVFTGAIMGSLVGFAVPYFFHRPQTLPDTPPRPHSVSFDLIPVEGGGLLSSTVHF